MKKERTIMGTLVGVAAFLYPFIDINQLFFGASNAKYFFVTGITTILVLWWITAFYREKISIPVFWRKPLVLTSLALYGVYVLSAVLGVHPAQSFWSDILRSSGVIFLTYALLFSFVTSSLLSQNDWRFVRTMIAYASGIFGFLFFFGTEGIVHGTGKFFESHGLSFGNTTFAGTFLVFGVFFTLAELVRRWSEIKQRYIFLGLFIVQVFSPALFNLDLLRCDIPLGDLLGNPLLILGSAQASSGAMFIGLAFIAGWYLIGRFVGKGDIQKMFAGLSLLVVFVSIALLLTPESSIQNIYGENSSLARPLIWENVLPAIGERPLLGWGPENFEFAFWTHFDSRLYFEEYGSEVWFDRAHNMTIDTLVEVGVLGLLLTLLLYIFLTRVFVQAGKEGELSEIDTLILGSLIWVNLLQMQTSFNTVTTLFLFAILLGMGMSLEKQVAPVQLNKNVRKGLAGAGAILMIVGLQTFILGELSRQSDIVKVFTSPTQELRLERALHALERTSSFETLRQLSMGLVEGTFGQVKEGTLTQGGLEAVRTELAFYEDAYLVYLEKTPNDYRATVDLAYLYLAETVLGVPKVSEAHAVLEKAYGLSEGNPLTYMMDSLAYLYEGDFDNAERVAKEGLALNSDIVEMGQVYDHVVAQRKNFPEIEILQLQNI